ncbi:MAG: MopE-related protein, partial [Saprospiraceae bacterium]
DAGSTTLACTAPTGFVANDDDCDDTNANVNPAATEICNLIDDNCDGTIDEGVQSTFYADTDGDTYGDAGSTAQACTAPTGFVANDDDCDDTNANVNPAATEVCNLIDDNCDGNIDEGVQSTFYADADGDTYGDAGSTTLACTAPTGFVANDDDCDDTNANINPSATEICNGIDDDCDGDIDEGGAQVTYYADADGDTYGDPAVSQQACTPPTGFVTNDDDCNDANAAINPAATEICNNGTDENCDASDGITDMDATLTPDCNMANGNAVAISGVVGGAAPLQYSSDNGATFQASPNFTGLTPGSYTFVTQDAAGCTASEFVTINAPMSTIITGANPNCAGGSDGSVSASVSGGYAPLSYSWTNSMSVVVGTTAAVTGLPAGIYNLSVTDDKGCVASGSFSLSNPTAISASLSVASTPCFGQANGVVNSTVSGGQGGYAYLWSNGSTTANISNATAGTHTVTVTDIAGCQKTASVVVGTKPQLKVTTTTKNVTCAGYNDGTASANGTGGTGSNSSKTYLWSTGATTKNITGLSAGNYTVTVTDVAGCTISKTVTINEPAPLVLALTHTPIVCNGQANGTGSANATGGTGGKTYVWSTGSTAKSISYLGAGTYTVTATDTKMCQITGSFTLTEPPVLAITNIISAPSGTKYRVTVTATGGVPPLKYRRNTATGFTSANTTGIFTGLVAGTYTFRVEDANGCIVNQVQAIPVVLNLTGKNNGQQAQPTVQSLENVDFTLQPNPARSTAQLIFDHTQPTDGMVEIRSVSGALLRQISVENLAANGWQFQLDGLSHGVMLVSLRSGDVAPVTKRLVILD